MTNIRRGTIVQLEGETLTVKTVRRTIDTETPRYAGDTNPDPAGSVAVQFEGPALDCRVLRPGKYTVIKL